MNICIFGDSITWGAGDSQKGGWVERFKIYFNKKYDYDIMTYNLSINGNTTENLLVRIKNESEVRKPNIIVFAIGINDAQFIYSTNRNHISDNSFKNNIEKLYETAKKFTPKIIFIGLTSVDETKTKSILWNTNISYTNERIKNFDKIIKNFCIKNNLKFISVNNLLKNSDLADGLHPNTQGHIKMFKKIKSEIEFAVKE
ncbi:MAG: GDSL-type esterase/lipase family protein [bacterium]